MRTLYLRITITILVSLLLCAVVFIWMSARISRHTTGEFFRGSVKLQLQQSREAYERGGSAELEKYLVQVDSALMGTRYLTDATGRDLVSGVDRSDAKRTELNLLGVPKMKNGKVTIVEQSADGKYRLITIAPPPISLSIFVPYFVVLLLVSAAAAWALSAGIVSPLLKLADTVERFGRGDLNARIETARTDEIGAVSRAFNSMADRIQTLMNAERRLLQDVSHELRSPLARLSFATELLKNSENLEAGITRVRRESDRLTRLVSTLIEMASAEGDPESRRHERVDVSELIKQIVDDCSIEADARNTLIECAANSSQTIDGDPELLRRAIENVLRNAIRYSPQGTPVRITSSATADGIVITVRDQGPGVPEDKLARIFDPFFRADDSRDSASGGVGLGLSIARRAILVHHGNITATNASPGLEVTIAIPASTSAN